MQKMRRIMCYRYIDLKLEWRNSESKTTLKTNSLDLLFWIFWCTEQEHTFDISHRKSQEHELSAHILFKCLPFSLLNTFFFVEFEQNLKHRSVHTSQILRTKHTRQTRPFWIVSLHGTSTKLLGNNLLMARFLVTKFSRGSVE